MNSSVSRDFPLYHSNIIPLYVSHDEKHYTHKKSGETFVYTNEHPDMFRIEGMKEYGYRNPYLDEVIKVDRSCELKKMDFNRKQINLIDFIKSKRNYSQDPNIIKFIGKANDFDINEKRGRIKKDRLKLANLSSDKYRYNIESNNNNFNLSIDNNNKSNTTNNNALMNSGIANMKYTLTEPDNNFTNRMLNRLDRRIPKLDYKMKGTINLIKEIENEKKEHVGNITTSADEMNKFKKYDFFFDPKKSSYLRNSNDYKISEAQQRDLNKEINYQRRPIIKYNVIKDKYEKFNPPPYRGDHWGSFMENYFTLLNDPRQFRRKGGLFSEFSDRNKDVININKNDIHEKLQKEKEEKKRIDISKDKNINRDKDSPSNSQNKSIHNNK